MNPLFSSPDSDAARTAFAKKPRGLVDKVMTVAEAVRRFVRDGRTLAVGWFPNGGRDPHVTLSDITTTTHLRTLWRGCRGGRVDRHPDAVKLLDGWAGGPPDSALAVEAKAARARLGKR